MLQDSFENPEQNILRFKSRDSNRKLPTNKEAIENMKIQGITIFKNKKCSTWYTRYRKDGKQYYISGKTQKEVADKLRDRLNIIKKEKLPYTTFESWYNQWLNLFKIGKVKDGTLVTYRTMLNHIPDNFMQSNIKNVSALQIQELINRTPGNRTPQKLFEFLNDIFASAKKFNIIKNNPIEQLSKPKHTKVNGEALTQEDSQKFINQCLNDKFGDIFLVCLYLGLRRGELLAITGEDIKDSVVVINKSIDGSGEVSDTKTVYSNRRVPLFDNVKQILQKYKNIPGRIFDISARSCNRNFELICEKAGLPRGKYTVHSLRHTFITNCKNENIPEHIIQSWVGHQIGSKVTSTVYTHTQSDANNLFINKLNHSKFYSNSTQE